MTVDGIWRCLCTRATAYHNGMPNFCCGGLNCSTAPYLSLTSIFLLRLPRSVCRPLSSDGRLPHTSHPLCSRLQCVFSHVSADRKGAALHVMHMITLAGLLNFLRLQHCATPLLTGLEPGWPPMKEKEAKLDQSRGQHTDMAMLMSVSSPCSLISHTAFALQPLPSLSVRPATLS